MYIHQIFFIRSSVAGHLGCFHNLVVVYSAINIGVQVSLLTVLWIFIQDWYHWIIWHTFNCFSSAGDQTPIVASTLSLVIIPWLSFVLFCFSWGNSGLLSNDFSNLYSPQCCVCFPYSHPYWCLFFIFFW
jgi:hypothetical protein